MPRPATDLRDRVLRAARAAFDAQGFDGASLRAIARGAGTTIGMIYYYFPTKDALWDAVIDEVYQRFLREIAAVMAAPGTLRARLREMARHIASLGDDERTVIRLALRDALMSNERRARLFARFQQGHIPLVLGAVARAQAQGELSAAAPLAMISFAAGTALLSSQFLLGNLPLPNLPPDPALRTELMLTLLFDGIGARPDAASAPPAAPGRKPGR
jgi:AcrR family transcriptional regulator